MAQSRDSFANSSNQTQLENNDLAASSGVDLIHNTVLPSDNKFFNRARCQCCQVRTSRPCILVQTPDGAGLTQYDTDDTWRLANELNLNDINGHSASRPYVTLR